MGRPRGFDSTDVLNAARDAFWARGYEATSTRDLVKATGLTQPSLYNAFGDKRTLFLRVLDHYLNQTLRERIAQHESAATPGAALTEFFADVVQRSLDDKAQRGCLMVNSVLEAAPGDSALRDAITEELTRIRDFFLRSIDAGQRTGEMRADIDAGQAADHLLALLLGLRVIARVHPVRDWLVGAVSPALSHLGLRPLSLD